LKEEENKMKKKIFNDTSDEHHFTLIHNDDGVEVKTFSKENCKGYIGYINQLKNSNPYEPCNIEKERIGICRPINVSVNAIETNGLNFKSTAFFVYFPSLDKIRFTRMEHFLLKKGFRNNFKFFTGSGWYLNFPIPVLEDIKEIKIFEAKCREVFSFFFVNKKSKEFNSSRKKRLIKRRCNVDGMNLCSFNVEELKNISNDDSKNNFLLINSLYDEIRD
jgi:hypothetical protein